MMKKILLSLVIMFFIMHVNAQNELNVMTFNLRYDNPGDSLNAWPYRKDKVASQILFHNVHLLGVQEALHRQMTDLKRLLGKYNYVGVGRADGKEEGEYSAIFYDTTRLELLHGQTFWLSEKPEDTGKKGWDAAIERIVTWAEFRDKATRKTFYHFNTHFDHIGKVARRESAKLLLRKVQEIGAMSLCIVTGDFNAEPDDEPIMVLVNKENSDHLIDTKAISATPHYGPDGTFNGFTTKELSNKPIDYIFLNKQVPALKHAALSQTWQGRFSSDHFPVYAVLKME